jgi:single-strand DNA-binding protein
MNVNKAILIGNVGSLDGMRSTQTGVSVMNFSIATNEKWTDKQGQKQEKTEWHRIVVWGRTAEVMNEYLTKGRTVYVEGKIETRQWEDKEGQTRYTTEIKAERVLLLGGRGEQQDAAQAPLPSDAAPQQELIDDVP